MSTSTWMPACGSPYSPRNIIARGACMAIVRFSSLSEVWFRWVCNPMRHNTRALFFRHIGLRLVASTWSCLAALLAPIAIVPELKSSRLGCLGQRILARVAVYTLPSILRIRNAAHRLRLRLNSLESPWRSLLVAVGKQARGCKLFFVANWSLFANSGCASPLAPRLSLLEAIVAARVVGRAQIAPHRLHLGFRSVKPLWHLESSSGLRR